MKSDATTASIPIILLTAKSDEESKTQGVDRGADAFVGKPFDEKELVSTVRNLLRLKEKEKQVEELNRDLTENVLKRYLSPELVNQIVTGQATIDDTPQISHITVVFADLVGFTSKSEELGPALTAKVLGDHLSAMSEVVFAHGGTIDKFIGDAVMVLFGAPIPMNAIEQAKAATSCALAMHHKLDELNEQRRKENLPSFEMRIGMHYGGATVGNFGSKKRVDYTVVGPSVNLASRIEQAAKPGEILMSSQVRDLLETGSWQKAGDYQLKGIQHSVTLYKVVATANKKVA